MKNGLYNTKRLYQFELLLPEIGSIKKNVYIFWCVSTVKWW